jgi:multicomponent Na+:H+ antiporter subunit E
MNYLLLNILLALAWVALIGDYTPVNFIGGFAVSYGILWISQRAIGRTTYFHKVPKVIAFFLYFIWELIKANFRVAYDIVTPQHHMRPAIIAVPLDVKTDFQITLLANLITLTPGTLSLDVSTDRRVLYIHTMYVTDFDRFRTEIKQGFERRILEMM